MKRKKWQKFIQSKGIEPKKNRQTFGFILFGTTIVVFFLFMVRFVYIIGVGKVGDVSLDDKTKQLYQGSSVVKAKRGSIYDRNGLLIAGDATSYSLYAVLNKEYLGLYQPKLKEQEKLYVQDKHKEQIAEIIAKNLPISKEEALVQLKREKNEQGNPQDQVEFGKGGYKISLEVKNQIEADLAAAKLKGLYFQEHPARMYPNGIFASHLIGYTKLADEADETRGLVGQMGIEETYNDLLSGQDGLKFFKKNNRQQPLPTSTEIIEEAINGQDLYLTIDAPLQSRAEDLVDKVMEKYQPEDLTVTLAEAKTGNILVALQRPTFNPETLDGLDKQWKNLLVEYPFEPGSTMKAFTVAAAIETGNFNPNATFQTGKIQVDDTPIYDHMRDGIGTITYRQALAWSSNVGMVQLQQAMDMKWVDYLSRFGFGKTTNSKLLAESEGSIQDGTTVDRAMTAYGQAISVTPFQMIQAFTSLTNEGKMLKPNYISKMVDSKGAEKKIVPEVVGQPIKASTATQVLDMMTDVVEDEVYGTGKVYKLDGYRVSAKTGTSQISEKGVYIADQYLYSVVQIAPTENPEYILYVTMRKPPMGIGTTGEEMIAEISNSLLERTLNLDVTNQVVDDK